MIATGCFSARHGFAFGFFLKFIESRRYATAFGVPTWPHQDVHDRNHYDKTKNDQKVGCRQQRFTDRHDAHGFFEEMAWRRDDCRDGAAVSAVPNEKTGI